MKKLNTAIAALTLAVTSTVNAGEITKWTYVNEAGFSAFTETQLGAVTESGDATPADILGVDASTLLTWGQGLDGGIVNGGVDGLQSSFESVSPVSGDIFTNGADVVGTDLIHNNFVVGAPDGYLTGATFLDGLSLIPTELDGFPLPPLPAIPGAPIIEIDIHFVETANGVDYGITGAPDYNTVTQKVIDGALVCPDGTLNGAGVNINGCADIFAVSSDFIDFEVVLGNLEFSESFNFDGYKYTVTTILSGLELITDEACNFAGLGDGCFGFLTEEETSNVLNAAFRIESELIPVRVSSPASLAILGLGLVGLGGIARRRKAK